MRQIEGYPDYFITENGEVYSKKYNKLRKKKLLKHPKGYNQIDLYKDGKSKTFLLHRLVALTFIPNPHNLPQVNHIDGNKLNNHISNLEWVTMAQNNQHAYDIGLKKASKGEKHYKTTLTEEQVKYIRENYIPRHPEFGATSLGKKFGVLKCTISEIVNNNRWKHI